MKKTLTTFTFFFTLFTFSFTLLNAQTYFTDNFEAGLSKWIVGGNSWDTLSTTYTSSNHCVTDSRIGNYIYNSDPTITKLSAINLTATSFPVLTFFHKYSLFEYYRTDPDFVYVEVSTNGGFNWSIVKSWQFYNNAWTYEQIDLRNYRTNNVKIRFHLSSHNSHGLTGDGWYIDDVSIKELADINLPTSFPFSDDFENGLGKWIVGGFNWDTLTSTHVSGFHCVTDSRFGNYIWGSDQQLQRQEF